MVTNNSVADFDMKEFQKRRLIRLEQVRQQSKVIAANIRDKMRKEKNKQLSEVEKRGERELKKWQARKLINLQEQYRECLKDIGLGHTQATIEERSDDAMYKLQENNELRQRRGEEALKMVRDNILKKKEEMEECNRKQKYNRAVENARSTMIINLHKAQSNNPSKRKKKRKEFKNVFDDNSVESDEESVILFNIGESEDVQDPNIVNSLEINLPKTSTSDKKIQVNLSSPKHQESENYSVSGFLYPIDTRISDRIKRRRYKSNFEVNDRFDTNRGSDINSGSVIIDQPVIKEIQTTSIDAAGKDIFQLSNTETQLQLPLKSKLILRPNEAVLPCDNVDFGSKVQYYDHKNRFTTSYQAPVTTVHKVDVESVQVCFSSDSEKEFVDNLYKRDRDALERGRIAMERVRVEQNYKDMMKQMSKLQRKERMALIYSNKPELYMDKEQLKEVQKRKQIQLEHAYEKVFPDYQVITIPPKESPKILQNKESSAPKKIFGTWDFDKSSQTKTVFVQDTESKFVEKVDQKISEKAQRKKKLQKMLKSLTEHRNKLAEELRSMPQESNLHEILTDFNSLDELLESGHSLDKASIILCRQQNAKAKTVSSNPQSPKPITTRQEDAIEKDYVAVAKQSPRNRRRSRQSKSHSPVYKTNSPDHTGPRSSPTFHKSLDAEVSIYTAEYACQKDRLRSPRARQQSSSDQQNPCANLQSFMDKGSKTHKLKSKTKIDQICPDKKSAIEEVCLCPSTPKLKYKKDTLKVSQICNSAGTQTVNTKGTLTSICKPNTVDAAVGPSTVTERKSCTEFAEKFKDPNKKECKCCAIKKQESDTCEIVIKICDDSSHKVNLNPTLYNKNEVEIEKTKSKCKCNSEKMHCTWMECLSQNSSSTSYYSPPNIHSQHKKFSTKYTSSAKDILHTKPQQRNLNICTVPCPSPNRCKLDNRTVLRYIKQLLTMSRGSVDELGVSTVSEVSTPHSSVINAESNITSNQQCVRHQNINPTINYKSPSPFTQEVSTCSPCDETIHEYAYVSYPGVLHAYNEMAESCVEKIEHLAAMIEKVRLEKLSIVSDSPLSDKENSTKYLDLPSNLQEPLRSPSPLNDLLQKPELSQQLLQVKPSILKTMASEAPRGCGICKICPHFNTTDEELMIRFKKLQGINDQKVKDNEAHNIVTNGSVEERSPLHKDVTLAPVWLDIPRLPKLEANLKVCTRSNFLPKQSKPPPSRGIKIAKCYNEGITVQPHELSTILEADSIVSSKLHKNCNSLGFITEKFHDLKMLIPSVLTPIVPEILSDNPEAEVYTLECKQSSTSSNIPNVLSGINNSLQIVDNISFVERETQSCTDRGIDTISIPSQTSLLSDSSTNGLDNIETALKSLGMGWAITTIRKTQESLALTSSSSSSSSSIDLVPVQLTNKISSSSKSTSTILSHNSSDTLSLIQDDSRTILSTFLHGLANSTQNPDSFSSTNKTSRKTSTPVHSPLYDQHSKHNIHPNIILSAESDISSIKQNSDTTNNCTNFYSLNEISNQTKGNITK